MSVEALLKNYASKNEKNNFTQVKLNAKVQEKHCEFFN